MVSGVWLNQRTVFMGRGPSGNGDFAGKIIELKWWNGWWPEGKKGPPIFDLTDLCWLMVIPSGNRFLALENTWESVCCDWRNNLEWNFNERFTSAKVCRLPKGFKGYIILPGLTSILWKGMIGMPMIQAIDLSARGFGSCSHVDVLIGKIQCFQHSFNFLCFFFKIHQPLVIVTIGPQWAVYSMNQIVLHQEWPRDQLLSKSIWTALRMVKSEFCLVKDPNKFPWLLPLNHHCSMVKFLFSPDEIRFSFFLWKWSNVQSGYD